MGRRRVKGRSKIKGIQTKISQGLKKELDKIRREYLDDMGIDLSYAEASELYRKNKGGLF